MPPDAALPTFAARVQRRARRLFHRRGARVFWPGGVVSITFDDFPRSALTPGAEILEQHGARGTYYAALNLAGTDGELGPMLEPEDVAEAHRRGHEIACHTYRHVNCRLTGVSRILDDIDDNGAALAALLDGFAPANFAYPFGELSIAAKGALGGRFRSCRGIRQGFNAGIADFAELRATHIHNHDFDADATRRLIDRNRAANGWLIFYTHDVRKAPSRYGCTPDQLRTVVALATERGPILPVRDVIGGLGIGAAVGPGQ